MCERLPSIVARVNAVRKRSRIGSKHCGGVPCCFACTACGEQAARAVDSRPSAAEALNTVRTRSFSAFDLASLITADTSCVEKMRAKASRAFPRSTSMSNGVEQSVVASAMCCEEAGEAAARWPSTAAAVGASRKPCFASCSPVVPSTALRRPSEAAAESKSNALLRSACNFLLSTCGEDAARAADRRPSTAAAVNVARTRCLSACNSSGAAPPGFAPMACCGLAARASSKRPSAAAAANLLHTRCLSASVSTPRTIDGTSS
mmetsp:Transcript_17283/g.47115  ORF Transcript_17283/g.47115 Transcript_17283/m.47115 type:complete len:262 (-) Transcript_17283:131-916(-)